MSDLTPATPDASTTQQQYPAQAGRRTFVQTLLGVVAVLGLVVPAVVAILGDELGSYLPPAWAAWLAAAGALSAAVARFLSRVMAIPAVDAWLEGIGLGSAPKLPPPAPPGAADQ